MTTTEQARKMLNGYVTNRETLESITVPASATMQQMQEVASQHGLSLDVVDGEVQMSDECYTYAVRSGDVATIAG